MSSFKAKFYEIWGPLTFRNHSIQIPTEATAIWLEERNVVQSLTWAVQSADSSFWV